MSVLTISAASPVGVLADGTPYYAPIGEVIVDGSLVTCHLCGRALRSVTAHLRAHGWTKLAYCEAFGLERGQSLEGQETRKLRAVALASRLVFEPAMRQGSAAGRARARTGALARDAARAATGRSIPEQRRRKAAAALAAVPQPLVARANRDRAARHLASVAAEVARQQGHADLGAFVLARIEEGASLAVISREAGLNKDWLSRHLGSVDPVADAAARRRRPQRLDTRWLPNAPSLRRGCAGRRARGPRTNRRRPCQTTFGRPPGPLVTRLPWPASRCAGSRGYKVTQEPSITAQETSSCS
jgi:hypothetical protein